jgi:thiamine-monophosphate kinase
MPSPRIEVGQQLSKQGLATSMIDISDGLVADLHHLCAASGVGARIEKTLIPVDANLKSAFRDKMSLLALAGGEDFELLFTSTKKNFSHINSTRVTRIGEVTPNEGVVELVDEGRVSKLPPLGYRHF